MEEKENKIKLIRIILSAVLLAVAVALEKLVLADLPEFVHLLIYLCPYLVIGYDVIIEAGEGIIHGEVFGEEFLMTIATIGALCIGFFPDTEAMYSEAVFVMLFFGVGELFEEIAEGKTKKSITKLMDLRPDSVNVERNGELATVLPDLVEVGEIVVVRPGERVALDGVVIEGESSLDTSALTGESVARGIGVGDNIVSGSINLSGVLKMKVTKPLSESTVTKILELVENASENKSRSESFIERFSKVYTPLVVCSALLLAFIPPIISGNFVGNIAVWLKRALTFLVISCPCALVVSVPLAFFGGIGGASRAGILIKGSNHIDKLSRLGTVVFDKTGTLTKGVFKVTIVHPVGMDENELLHIAAHVERYSYHPIAVSLREAYENEDDSCDVADVTETAGEGALAKVNGRTVAVGNEKMMKRVGAVVNDCRHNGTIVHIAVDGEYVGHIVISDEIKDNSAKAVGELGKLGIRTYMLTGDRESTAGEISKTLGLDGYAAELLPADKLDRLEKIIDEEKKITAFAGDGINDAPALARADTGIAMGAFGSDAAIEAADVVLMNDDPYDVVRAVRISRRTIRIARENIVFALGVKLAVLVLAALGIAPMWLAVFADVGVTVLAVLNSVRTLKVKN